MKSKKTRKRCKRCILPSTVPGITFNRDGICNYCLDYSKDKVLGKKELDKIITSSKYKNNKYDCIVPISGGRDSTFTLYVAKAIYNLKVLAVNYDNEFRTNQALINMKRACKILDVDFISIRSKRNIAQKIVKNSMLFFASFYGFPLGGVCSGCVYGYKGVVYRAALQHRVPLILWGNSQIENTAYIREKAFGGLKLKWSKLSQLLNIGFYKSEYCRLLQRLEFHVPGNIIIHRKRPILKNRNIREISFFDYIPWNREEIKNTIMEELGWEKPRGQVSTWKTDCILHPVVNYFFIRMFGCSKDCFGYCKMINSGQMERQEALRQEEEIVESVMKNIRRLLEDRIGFSKREVIQILSTQLKSKKRNQLTE